MEKLYTSMLKYIRKHLFLEQIILWIMKFFPYITFLIYPCVLVYLMLTQSSLLLPAILKPLGAFLFVTIFRKIINRPRPYEVMDIQPLIHHKHGESFPSRHTLSAFMIALVCLPINMYLGIFALIVATIISVSRIVAGVHFISDVVVSVIIAFFFYFI